MLALLFPPGRETRIPVAVIAGSGDNAMVSRATASIAECAGHCVGLVEQSGACRIDGETVADDIAPEVAALVVLSRTDVDLAVIEHSAAQILESGLAVDACAVATITGIATNGPGDEAVAARVAVENAYGTVILDGDDPACAALAQHAGEAKIFLVSMAPANPIVAEHVDDGGLAVTVETKDGGAVVSLRRGTEHIPLATMTFSETDDSARRIRSAVFARRDRPRPRPRHRLHPPWSGQILGEWRMKMTYSAVYSGPNPYTHYQAVHFRVELGRLAERRLNDIDGGRFVNHLAEALATSDVGSADDLHHLGGDDRARVAHVVPLLAIAFQRHADATVDHHATLPASDTGTFDLLYEYVDTETAVAAGISGRQPVLPPAARCVARCGEPGTRFRPVGQPRLFSRSRRGKQDQPPYRIGPERGAGARHSSLPARLQLRTTRPGISSTPRGSRGFRPQP